MQTKAQRQKKLTRKGRPLNFTSWLMRTTVFWKIQIKLWCFVYFKFFGFLFISEEVNICTSCFNVYICEWNNSDCFFFLALKMKAEPEKRKQIRFIISPFFRIFCSHPLRLSRNFWGEGCSLSKVAMQKVWLVLLY